MCVLYLYDVFFMFEVWAISGLQLSYMNSLKMKLSVLVGITQMTFGLILKLGNHLHEGDWLSIYGEFVPQMIFMVTLLFFFVFVVVKIKAVLTATSLLYLFFFFVSSVFLIICNLLSFTNGVMIGQVKSLHH